MSKAKATAQAQVAPETSAEVAVTQAPETSATKRKGVAKGELQSFASSVLAKVQAGEIGFIRTGDDTFQAEHHGVHFELQRKIVAITSDKSNAKEMTRVRLTAVKKNEAGEVVSKRPETNGKDIWMHLDPEAKFLTKNGRRMATGERKERAKKAKVVVDHGDASAWL